VEGAPIAVGEKSQPGIDEGERVAAQLGGDIGGDRSLLVGHVLGRSNKCINSRGILFRKKNSHPGTQELRRGLRGAQLPLATK
jgi:hypothetical protein